jgi:hypothetical protein
VQRLTLFGLTILAVLAVSEKRLNRGEPNRTDPDVPLLWHDTLPPGQWAPPPTVTKSTSGPVVTRPAPAGICSLLIATDEGNSYSLTSVDAGVRFDIDGNGTPKRAAWTEPDSDVAFLALDQNGDGVIGSANELVGNRTVAGMPNGPRVLLQLADPARKRAVVDAEDQLMAKLLLWRDKNHNGTSEAEELRPAQDEIAAIGLGYAPHRRIDGHGNQSRYRGFIHVRTAPGLNRPTTAEEDRARSRHIYEVCFATGD